MKNFISLTITSEENSFKGVLICTDNHGNKWNLFRSHHTAEGLVAFLYGDFDYDEEHWLEYGKMIESDKLPLDVFG